MTKSRLEAVRRHRAVQSEHAQQDYAEKSRRVAEADAALTRLNARMSDIMADLSRRQATGIAPDELEAYRRYLDRAAQEITQARIALDRLREEAEASRTILVQARQDERLIGQVDDARTARLRRASRAREDRALDETSVTRRARRG